MQPLKNGINQQQIERKVAFYGRKDLRPDPDALLKEITKDDVKKGKLKIFLGYAPGVGKAFAMLNDARHSIDKRRSIRRRS
jgi:hypothetical protein